MVAIWKNTSGNILKAASGAILACDECPCDLECTHPCDIVPPLTCRVSMFFRNRTTNEVCSATMTSSDITLTRDGTPSAGLCSFSGNGTIGLLVAYVTVWITQECVVTPTGYYTLYYSIRFVYPDCIDTPDTQIFQTPPLEDNSFLVLHPDPIADTDAFSGSWPGDQTAYCAWEFIDLIGCSDGFAFPIVDGTFELWE